jgi:hypothetical protein
MRTRHRASAAWFPYGAFVTNEGVCGCGWTRRCSFTALRFHDAFCGGRRLGNFSLQRTADMHEAYSHRLDGMTDMEKRSSQAREKMPFGNKFIVETASGGSFEDLLMTSMK